MARIVLCVDDDPDDRELIRNAIFKVDPSYTVAHATNGKEALQFLQRADGTELPCLVIMDINMPVMNGWEFMEEFVKIRSTIQKKIDIYILSSSTDSVDIQKAKSNPEITDYIVKPLTPDLLKNIFLPENEKEQIH